MMNDDDDDDRAWEETAGEDPDWDALREEGEAKDTMSEMWLGLLKCMGRLTPPLLLRKRPAQSRLVVDVDENDEDPAATGPIEFTILDSATGKVLVKDRRNFTVPKRGTLLGSEVLRPLTPDTLGPCKWVLVAGELRRLGRLVYEVDGKRFVPVPTIKRIQIFQSGKDEPFVLWDD